MAEMNQDSASASAGIDLSQFYQVFFEEAGENLETMEQMLLAVDLDVGAGEVVALDASASAMRGKGNEPFVFEQNAQRIENARFVVHNEHAWSVPGESGRGHGATPVRREN